MSIKAEILNNYDPDPKAAGKYLVKLTLVIMGEDGREDYSRPISYTVGHYVNLEPGIHGTGQDITLYHKGDEISVIYADIVDDRRGEK